MIILSQLLGGEEKGFAPLIPLFTIPALNPFYILRGTIYE
ncbi:MAG: hypothetical protein ACJAZJ_000049 [Candidatus Endobugula sp.]|jgi:hypothetical protein